MSDNVSGRKQTSVESKPNISREKGTSSSDMSVYKSSAEVLVRAKGSKGSSVYKSSEEYFDYICDPCKAVGDHEEAQGFCTDCEEYLCSTCFRSHSRSKLSKHHTLLDKDVMPRKTSKLCDPCHTSDEKIEAVGYCMDCNEYLCSGCYKSHSRSKLSMHHELVGETDMSGRSDRTVASAMVKLNIQKEGACELKSHEEYTYIRDIGIKANTDEENCYITGMTLVSDTELVLCDNKNKSLKLIDTENGIIKDVLVLHAEPNGIAAISKDQVAVVLVNKHKIQIIAVFRELSVVRSLKTNGRCVDVNHSNGKLYVSFKEPVKFQILQLTGAIIKTIKPDSEILKHCIIPRHIAVSPDESLIYVSDWKTNKVFSMDMNGNMVSLYQGELEHPCDITISSCGQVYLCNRDQHIVYKMTPALSEAVVILVQSDGLFGPYAICFNTDKQHLYISSGSGEAKYKNFIKVYKY